MYEWLTSVNLFLTSVIAMAFSASSLSMASDSALRSAINGPHQVAVDSSGNLYVSEEYGKRILRLDPATEKVTTIAGNGRECCRRENVPARGSSVYDVCSIAVDAQGNVYIGGQNGKDGAFVRIIHAETGKIETLARGGFPNLYSGSGLLTPTFRTQKGL